MKIENRPKNKLTNGGFMQELIHQVEKIQSFSLDDENGLRSFLQMIAEENQLPFTLDDLEVIPTPLLRLCLSGVKGFDISKALISYTILLKLLDVENNTFMILHKKNTLRELGDVIVQIAERREVDISPFFPQAA